MIVVGRLGLGGWDAAEAVHEALLVVPGHVVGGDQLDIAEAMQRAAPERSAVADAFVLVQPDRRLRQRVVIRVPGEHAKATPWPLPDGVEAGDLRSSPSPTPSSATDRQNDPRRHDLVNVRWVTPLGAETTSMS